eukprot:TRINITY_DN8737_c0_g1_i1.p1 TRINITY_DN8737_c0_g1~~TRINITY_DN8737_c0_g1_i1.p1  ORF type:complete len:464 (-),score=104.11 TRINITY_DN8737_c0_g1_i1:70-1338(-)
MCIRDRVEQDVERQAAQVHSVGVGGVYAVSTALEHAGLLKTFWQHTGEIITSRLAGFILDELWEQQQLMSTQQPPAEQVDLSPTAACLNTLRTRISEMAGSDPEDVYIFPSGMNAVYNAHKLAQALRETRGEAPAKSAVFGFPYLDTLKLLGREELGAGVEFFPHEDQYDELEAVMCQLQGVYYEYPTNPLLRLPDVPLLSKLGEAHCVPVIMDHTVGFGSWSHWGHDRSGPDILVSSLSKVFNGVGNAMGGSLVLNKHRPLYSELKPLLEAQYECTLYKDDAQVLLANSANVAARCKKSRESALQLVEYLRSHPEVAQVHAAQTPDGLMCGLISVVLHQKHLAPLFYDNLDFAKGPGFGTNFTLACPYAVLAHYNELDWCKECGVEPSLVRVWVGLDPCLLYTSDAADEEDSVDLWGRRNI